MEKSDIKNFVIYNLPTALPFLLGFVAFSIYTNYLIPEEFGIRAIIIISILVFEIITNFGVNWIIRARFYDKQSVDDFKSQFTTILFVVISARLFFFFVLSSIPVNKLFQIFFPSWNEYYTSLFSIQLFVYLANSPNNLIASMLVMAKSSSKYSVVQLLLFFVSTISSIVLLIIFNQGLKSLFWGEFLGEFLSTILGLFLLKEYFRFKFSSQAVKDLLTIGLPALPKNIFSQFQQNINKYLVQIFLPVADLGIFYKSEFLRTGFKSAEKAYTNAFAPENIKRLQKLGHDRSIFKIQNIWMNLLAVGIALTTIFMVDIFDLFHINPAFILCAKIAPIFGSTVLLSSYEMVLANNILVAKKTYIFTLRAIITGTSNILLNIVLINLIGLLGAVIASVFTALFSLLIGIYFNNKYVRILDDINLITYFLVFISLLPLFYVFYTDLITSFVLKIIIFFVYLSILALIDIFSNNSFFVSNLRNLKKFSVS